MIWTPIDIVALTIIYCTYGFNFDKEFDEFLENWEEMKDIKGGMIACAYETASILCKKIRKHESDNMNNPATTTFNKEN